MIVADVAIFIDMFSDILIIFDNKHINITAKQFIIIVHFILNRTGLIT